MKFTTRSETQISEIWTHNHQLLFSGWMLLLFLICIIPTAVFGQTLTVPGTGACEKVLLQIALSYNELHPENQVIIPPSTGSGGGIKAVSADKATLARVARPLSEQERESSLEYRPFARDAILFTTGNKIRIKNLSSNQLSAIFTGTTESWYELDNSINQNNALIRVLVRENTDSSLQIIRQRMQGFSEDQFSTRSKTVYHDYEMLRMLQKYPTSIGWLTGSSLIDNEQHLGIIQVDGVAPTAENIRRGIYPLIAEYALVYKEQTLSTEARGFIEFVFSAQGAKVLNRFGLIPIQGNQ